MPRLFIDVRKVYPVYNLYEDKDEEEWFIDLTDDEFKDYKLSADNYEKWQKRLKTRADEIDPRASERRE